MKAAACRFALLAHPGSRRALGFSAACLQEGFPEPRLVGWEDWLSPGFDRAAALAGIDALRIETPAENLSVERSVLRRGAPGARQEGSIVLAEDECLILPPDDGELRYQRQWYLGWCTVLAELGQLSRTTGIRTMNDPAEIAVLFDKQATREVLQWDDVPLPPSPGVCVSFEDLLSKMQSTGWSRVFLKPCHGSSATGVMAIARSSKGSWQVVSSAHLVGSRIRNSKQLRRLTDEGEIRSTVDAVCGQRALLEKWFPKATWKGKAFDLRVIVIAGKAAHVAMRTSSFPITNLHLRNQRGEVAELIDSLGTASWRQAMQVAEHAAASFPGCHYCGVDLMLGPGGKTHAVAEVNAFGDLLHRELWQGMNPWEAELRAWPLHSC